MAYYESLILYFDGASRNNPRGPAGCGWVLYDNDGYELNEIESGNNYLGYNVSNNQAEYQGLTDGLDYIVNNEISCHELLVRGDAEIVIRQMTGRYQVRSHNIIPYYNEAQASLAQVDCDEYGFYHISRDGNGEADQLANEAIDGEGYY